MYSLNVLISFDMIFDTELALLTLIREKYLDPEEFNFDLITQPPSVLKYLLKYRGDMNPLVDFVVNKEDAEAYYYKFLEEKYDEILEYTEETSIFNLVVKFITSKGMVITTILYHDEREEKLIDKFNKYGHINKLLVGDWKEDIDLNKYDTIYLKDYKKVLLFDITKFSGKNVYISSNIYNMTLTPDDTVIPDVDVSALCMDYNEIAIIDLYKENQYSEYSEPDEDYNEDNEDDYDSEDFEDENLEEDLEDEEKNLEEEENINE